MILRHGLPIHEVRDERALLHRLGDRDGVGVPVDRREHHVVGGRLDLGAVQQIAERHAGPHRRRDEVAADVVRDALERVRLLDRLEIEELVVGDRERRLDLPLDLERPAGDVDARLHERRIHGVVILVRGDARGDPRDRVDRRIRGREVGARPQPARGGRRVAEVGRPETGDPRQRQRGDPRESGERGRGDEGAPPRRRRGLLPRERGRQKEGQPEKEDQRASGRVDEARDRLDALGGEHPREHVRGDPGKEPDRDDRAVAASGCRREETRHRAVDLEEHEHADAEQDLRPLVQRFDERDRDEAREDVDDRLAEAVGHERQPRHAQEERDVEGEEHREGSDEQSGARPPVEPAHVWHDTPRCLRRFPH